MADWPGGVVARIDPTGEELRRQRFRPNGTARRAFDMAVTGWLADYPHPFDFLRQLDGRTIRASGNVHLAYFDDPGYNRRRDAAMGLT